MHQTNDSLPMFRPSRDQLARLQRLCANREEIRRLQQENASIVEKLDDVPDGVKFRFPELGRTCYRQRSRISTRLVDLPKVADHFLRPTLIGNLVTAHFRDTGEEPAGTRVEVLRGNLCFTSWQT